MQYNILDDYIDTGLCNEEKFFPEKFLIKCWWHEGNQATQ